MKGLVIGIGFRRLVRRPAGGVNGKFRGQLGSTLEIQAYFGAMAATIFLESHIATKRVPCRIQTKVPIVYISGHLARRGPVAGRPGPFRLTTRR